MKNLLALLFLSITILSCKNEKKEPIPEENVMREQEQEDYMEIRLNATIPLDDVYSLQYKDEDLRWYPKGGVEVNVKGSEEPQLLLFKIPENKFPLGFRFLVGKNNKENAVINSLSFKKGDNEFLVSSDNIFQFLNPNKVIEFNRKDNSYKLLNDEKARPIFNSRGILIRRLEDRVY